MGAVIEGIASELGAAPGDRDEQITDGPARPYFFTPHIHLCVTPDWPVILDLRTSRYQGVTSSLARVLSQHVAGWPVVGTHDRSRTVVPLSDQQNVLAQLVSAGVLTTDPSLGRPATPVSHERAKDALTREDLCRRPKVSWLDTGRFYRAMVTAKMTVRNKSMQALVEYLRERRLRALAVPLCDIERARELVLAFRYLRPLIFNAKKQCLLDSFALMEYVLPEGFVPHWVIGVRARPFLAHSWLCSGGLVWGDQADYVRNFTPIAKF